VHIGDTGTMVNQGPRYARAYFIAGASGCSMKKIKERSASHAYSSIEKIRTELA
jgi:hypothetical protein